MGTLLFRRSARRIQIGTSALAALWLSTAPSLALSCKFDGGTVIDAAYQLGSDSIIAKTGEGQCEIVGASIMASSVQSGLSCEVTVFPNLVLTGTWNLDRVKIEGDPFQYLSAPSRNTPALSFSLRIDAPVDFSKSASIMYIIVKDDNSQSCPSEFSDIVKRTGH